MNAPHIPNIQCSILGNLDRTKPDRTVRTWLALITYSVFSDKGKWIVFTREFSFFREVDANIPDITSVYIHDDFKIY